MKMNRLSPQTHLLRLQPPTGKVKAILDTDTFNEVDDQFALAHAMLSPESIDLQAVFAAPFLNHRSKDAGDGMEKSFAEIHRVFKLMGRESAHPVYRGSATFLTAPDAAVESDAARNLVERAHAMPPDEPLYVIAIGAYTNIASAILLDRSIIERIVVVILGGQSFHYHTAWDFNLGQDLHASRLLFDCGVPLIHIPCHDVTSHLLTTVHEVQHYLGGKNALGDYLVQILREWEAEDKMAGPGFAWSKIIWDISATAWFTRPEAFRTEIVHSPVLTDNYTWSVDRSRHFIGQVTSIDRNRVFGDVFNKLAQRR